MNKKIICLAVSAAMAVSLSTAFSITSFAENESSAESYAESVTTQESESSDAENSRKEESSKQESREKQKYTLTVISEETGKTTTVKNVVEGTSVMSLIDNKTLDFALLDAEGNILYLISDSLDSNQALMPGSSILFRVAVDSDFVAYMEANNLVPATLDVIGYCYVDK